MKKALALAVVASLAVALALCATRGIAPAAESPKTAAKADPGALMGSANYFPSDARPVGWRGDGSGHYPGATPPTQWYVKENGESKNILWKTKLPCYSWSTPVIVGDKIFTRSEPYDLICLNKNTGKLLWIRSHPPIVAATDAEKQAKPGLREAEETYKQLEKVNQQFVENGWSKGLYEQKYKLQKLLNDQTAKADPKYALPPDMYVESWAGYTGSTPCSDGQHLYFYSGDGVTACYDLNGNKKWTLYEQIPKSAWGEHGTGWSPALVGNRLLLRGKIVDKATGVEICPITYLKPCGDYSWSTMPFKSGGKDYALAFGNVFRVSDGKSIAAAMAFCTGSPVMNNGIIYYCGGLWLSWVKVEPQPNGDPKVTTVTPTNKQGYQNLAIPVEDEKTRWDPVNATSSSPLYNNGLLYVLTVRGRLIVADVEKDEIAYIAKPPFDFKNPFGRKSTGMGLGSSPALAGKYIYMLDSAGCCIVMEPGRQYKQVARNNIDCIVPDGWEPTHWMGPHHEQTEASLVFDGNRIYMRGEQFLYCIGEK